MKPDARKHRAGDGEYIKKLIQKAGMTQEEAAEQIGIGPRTMRYAVQRGASYPVQFCLEALAAKRLPPRRD